MRRPLLALIVVAAWSTVTGAHDIPNARVDRSIQVTVTPGHLKVDYEVGLSELTLTQDLRALIGVLPGGDRREWLDQYGRVSGPLNAKGLLVSVDDRPLVLRARGFDLTVEEHPRYTFHFEADLPPRGRLSVRDTNYETGEGTSRLALKGVDGAVVEGDTLPRDVALIAVRPLWQLTREEERRTSQAEVRFGPGEASSATIASAPVVPKTSKPLRSVLPAEGLSRLLDRSATSGIGLWLVALALGAAHAVQPGHGKSLVAAASIGERGGWHRGVALALVITFAHMGGVLAVAVALWATRSTRYPDINRSLAHAAGFAIAAIGVWRLGRHLGGYGEHDEDGKDVVRVDPGARGLIGLGLAGGLVPCWDAVVLILLSEAVGRLALGLALLAAFSLGMASVLVIVGVVASHLRGVLDRRDGDGTWVRRLGMLSALALVAIGTYLMLS